MINSFLKIYLFVYAFVELLIYTVQVVLEPLWRPLTVIRKKVLIHSLNSCMAPSFSTLSFPPFLFLISAFTCFQTFLRNISTIFEQVCIKKFVLYNVLDLFGYTWVELVIYMQVVFQPLWLKISVSNLDCFKMQGVCWSTAWPLTHLIFSSSQC